MKKILFFIALAVITLTSMTGTLFASGVTSGNGKMSGIVTDKETGQPLEGVTIKLFFPSEKAFHQPFPKTDQEGKWKVLYIRKGRWDIDFVKPGYEVIKISYYVDPAPGRAIPPIELALPKMQGPSIGQEVVQEIENAKNLMAEGKIDQALKALEDILAKYKEETGIDIVYLYIGNCYAMQNQYAKAIEFFKKSLEKFPKNKEIILSIGNAYNNLQDYDQALQWFDQLKIEEISNVDTLYNIGAIAYNKGDLEKAATFFKKSIEVDQDFADGYYQLGMALTGMDGKQADAVAALQKFIELAPDSPNVETAKAVIDAYKDVK